MDNKLNEAQGALMSGSSLCHEIRTSVASYFSPVMAVIHDLARTVRQEQRAEAQKWKPEDVRKAG